MALREMLSGAAVGRTTIEPGWTQGRATFGGLVGALLLSAIRAKLRAPAPPLRSLTISFIAPAVAGEAELEATVLRAGSNVTQCQAYLLQEGQVVAAALASFGAHRDSEISVDGIHPMPDLGESSAVEAVPYIEGLTPEFFRHVELRVAAGGLPFSGAAEATQSGWMSLRETPEVFTEEHLVTLVDAWPPAVLQMLSSPAAASSLTWTLELVAELDGVDPATHWAYEVSTDAARDGYAHTEARVWSPNGALVAISRQTVAFFG